MIKGKKENYEKIIESGGSDFDEDLKDVVNGNLPFIEI